MSNRFGNANEIAERLEDANQNLKRSRAEVNGLGALITALQESVQSRRERYIHFQQVICGNTRINFTSRMRERQYRGRLHFDHINKTLDLLVEKENQGDGDEDAEQDAFDENEQEMVGPDMKSLSGGEKSFSTICLLLALWEHMQVPFRALDEFGISHDLTISFRADVFMDAVNRKVSMELITKFGHDSGIQYIFITPVSGLLINRLAKYEQCSRSRGTVGQSSPNA